MKPTYRSSIVLSFAGVVLLSACSGTEPDPAVVTTTVSSATATSGSEFAGSTTASTTAVTSTPVTSTPASGEPQPCATGGMDIGILSQQGAAGSMLFDIGFTNTAQQPCTLNGFPGVSLVGSGNGTQLGLPAVREGVPASEIELAPGATAYSPLRITRAENFNDCGLVPADGLRVYPPGQTESVYLPLDSVSACTAEGELLSVQPVRL
ncbi:DUF4232 domain-containing protein [Corynebacterium pacaense]|uniref:DUF4232 domain-containing protein n=1 Tax=Corynebacterium pacaense TaxID=1816684 RepID=UPI0009BA2507|nr:DUF4232 domain-containing protein [Corynebacterium pacaense]